MLSCLAIRKPPALTGVWAHRSDLSGRGIPEGKQDQFPWMVLEAGRGGWEAGGQGEGAGRKGEEAGRQGEEAGRQAEEEAGRQGEEAGRRGEEAGRERMNVGNDITSCVQSGERRPSLVGESVSVEPLVRGHQQGHEPALGVACTHAGWYPGSLHPAVSHTEEEREDPGRACRAEKGWGPCPVEGKPKLRRRKGEMKAGWLGGDGPGGKGRGREPQDNFSHERSEGRGW